MISNGLSRGRFVGSTGMVVSICMSSCGRRQKIGLDMFGEFFILHPETIHHVCFLFCDYGTPQRHMVSTHRFINFITMCIFLEFKSMTISFPDVTNNPQS